MLQVAVCDPQLLETAHHGAELGAQVRKTAPTGDFGFDVALQGDTLHQWHLDDRIPGAVDQDALLVIVHVQQHRGGVGVEEEADGVIACPPVRGCLP